MSLEHLLLCPANQLLDPEKALEERVISQIHEIRLVGFSHMLLLYNVPSFGMDGGSSRCYLRPRGIKHKVWKSLKKSHFITMSELWAIFVLYFCEISDILRIILLPWKIKWDIFGWFSYTVIRGILSPVYEYWVVLPTFIWVCEQLGLDRMGGRWSRVQIIIRPPPFLLTFSEVQLSQYIVLHTAGKWLHLLSSRKSFPK